MTERTIFLLENDNDTRPIFKKVLQDNGYNVLLAVDEEDALQKTSDGFVKSDLLMVNLVGKSEEEMLNFGNLLREKGKPNVPLVVVAAKYGEELEGTIKKAGENAYIIYLGEGDELLDLLSNLTNPNMD
jgi:DNA-binding response OmpR family regulator